MDNNELRLNQGSTIHAGRITAINCGISFSIPQRWIAWSLQNGQYPNLHLTPGQLEKIKIAEAGWDKEFSIVINALLPFASCFAHVGSEGWGNEGMSFADLQVRGYCLDAAVEEWQNTIEDEGRALMMQKFPGNGKVISEKTASWKRFLFSYFLMFEDYGATAFIDIRLKQFNERTVAFSFMYTSQGNHEKDIEAIINAVTIK